MTPNPTTHNDSKGVEMCFDKTRPSLTFFFGDKQFLGGGWTNPFEKYAQVKLDHVPRVKIKNIWVATT